MNPPFGKREKYCGAVAILLLLAVALLCAYELCAVYVTAGSSASERYSPSGFFFGISAIALAINMLFICRMVFNGNGLDVDEYVRRAYKFAYSDCIEVGPLASLPEPPDPNELHVVGNDFLIWFENSLFPSGFVECCHLSNREIAEVGSLLSLLEVDIGSLFHWGVRV
ncbi:calpain-type cysteine protease DEK1 [Cucumis melo var. makuwa]|uniref:Calpain-type cysteine protease DEK1 n=1 Tax=Cucumis melo var. makuwa TaxID=1194695 RepID=A0A5D3CFG4_CUCMM|nr:calpain-type cysteine protease DEK1 [Cucumis melo var. makuwa]